MRRTRAFFTSQNATSNFNGRFEWNWREPIVDIFSLKVKKVVINSFVGVANSAYYFLRSDCLALTRSSHTMNGEPSQVVCVIPTAVFGPCLFIEEEDESEAYNTQSVLHNLWFEIRDSNGNIVNPPDVGWSFCVELQLIVRAH
jgi:hypothetical protein